MAGVLCTIATIWEIADDKAVNVTKGFYQVFKNQDKSINIKRSTRALYISLIELRNRKTSSFT